MQCKRKKAEACQYAKIGNKRVSFSLWTKCVTKGKREILIYAKSWINIEIMPKCEMIKYVSV